MTTEDKTIFNNLETAKSGFDSMIEMLMVALLIFMPLAFGAVQAWSEQVVIIVSGVITVCFLLKLALHPNTKFIWTWAYLPMTVFVLIAAFQLLPLPAGLISAISPHTAKLKTDLLSDLPNAKALLNSMTISFYPNATKQNLRLVLAIAAVFVVVVNVFRHPDQIKRLLLATAIIGGGIALVALMQNAIGNGKIYGFVSTPDNTCAGPFVCYSHYSQFMNLSIGAALGWLFVKLRQDFSGRRIDISEVFEYLSSPSAKVLLLPLIIICIGAATIFISMSRGGMISLLIAMAFTTVIIISRKSLKGNGWIMVVMALAAFTCVLYMGFDAVYDRLATLGDIQKANNGRLQILEDIAVIATRFPVLGTGLGTHSVVYPMFDGSIILALATHAENEYAQALEETGLVGLGALIIFGIIIWVSYARNARRADLPIGAAVYGLGFGLLAILVHSLSDFGQHLPANAMLSAIFCGLLIVLTRIGRERQQETISATTNPWISIALRTVILLIASAIMSWSVIGANSARIAAAHNSKAFAIEKTLSDNNWQGTDGEYEDLISHTSAASSQEPENIHYRYWLNLYRWYDISRTANQETGIVPRASILLVQNIIEDLHNARVLCPTFGPVYSSLGTLEMFVLNDYAGSKEIKKGFLLAPCNPKACFAAGFLDIIEGKTEDSLDKFNRAIQLDGKLFRDVVDIYAGKMDRPDLAVTVAGQDRGKLNYVARILAGIGGHDELVTTIHAKTAEQLKTKSVNSDASAWELVTLAGIYAKEQDNEAAIECYRQALAQDYSQVSWRMALARLLVKTEKIPEAMHEARMCLKLRPQLKAAEKLIADLSLHPIILNMEDSTE